MIEELVPDRLWERVAVLLPAPSPTGTAIRADRAALAGIVFVLKMGFTWNQCLPRWSAARE